jgi:hypothetical protein
MTVKKPTPILTTAGVIAAEMKVSLRRVQYILATRPHIQPAARAGTLRLYEHAAVAIVRDELSAMDARRQLRKGGPDGR